MKNRKLRLVSVRMEVVGEEEGSKKKVGWKEGRGKEYKGEI